MHCQTVHEYQTLRALRLMGVAAVAAPQRVMRPRRVEKVASPPATALELTTASPTEQRQLVQAFVDRRTQAVTPPSDRERSGGPAPLSPSPTTVTGATQCDMLPDCARPHMDCMPSAIPAMFRAQDGSEA